MNLDISNKEMLKIQKLELLIYLTSIGNIRYKLKISKTFHTNFEYQKENLELKGYIQELNYSKKINHEMNKMSLLFFPKMIAQKLYFDYHYIFFQSMIFVWEFYFYFDYHCLYSIS